MAQNTDLNVAPYYDDHASSDNFVKTLFRPGYAIQARELTQMQSVLQNQLEKGFSHIFEDGTMVIPGQLTYRGSKKPYRYVKLQNTFSGETIDVTQYVNTEVPVVLTGLTSGVKFMVVDATAATSTDPATLYGHYVSVNLRGSQLLNEQPAWTASKRFDRIAMDAGGNDIFVLNEQLSANVTISHGTNSYVANSASLMTAETETADHPEFATGSLGPMSGFCALAHIEPGIYFVRGFFVEVLAQTHIIQKYRRRPSARVGLSISESIVTPESDTSLLDNATGSSNYSAKGAHRLKFGLTLTSIALDSTEDENFIEILRLDNGVIKKYARTTDYSIIEETLARRTFDESGNYTVRPFTFQVKESVDISIGAENFDGVYNVGDRTDDGVLASNSLAALQVSSGKAYVKGFEIEKLAPTFIDVNKAREFATINASSTAFDIGNYVNISNLYGSPDVTFISGESTAFKQIQLYDTFTATRGVPTGSHIGVARARTYEYSSGTVGSAEAVYKLFLFDIRPFTIITLSGTPSPTLLSVSTNGGNRITGSTSNATGYVFGSGTTGTKLILTNVSGKFVEGETLVSSNSSETSGIIENSSNADLTITKVVSKTFDEVRAVFMDDPDTGHDFTADVVLTPTPTAASFINLDGTDSTGANNGELILSEQEQIPLSINIAAAEGTGSSRNIAKLQDAEKNISLFKLAKRPVKTLLTATNSGVSDTQFYIRKQFIATSTASGAVSVSSGANEVFVSHAEKDYAISVLTAGSGGIASAGDIVSAATGFSGGGTSTLTITNSSQFGTDAKVKIMATLLKTSVVQKTKTAQLMKQVKVVAGTTDAFGTRPSDRVISLGRADVFRLSAVYESIADDTDAVSPILTLTNMAGTFTRGERITGQSSNTRARIITTDSTMEFVYTSGPIKTFISNEVITGESSGATATVSSLTTGDKNITANYLLDNGQRDNFYDTGRIHRKTGVPAPIGRLLIVFDYLEHGSGDFFSVDSYSDVANQMDYVDIPTYTATKVDPDAPAPTGEFPLYNVFDFRPTVENTAGSNTDVATVDELTGYSFDFYHRQYDGTGSSANNFIKPGSLVQADYEYYLPKRATLDLSLKGNFILNEGESSENPPLPISKDGVMRLAEMFIPAYTFKSKDIVIKRQKNQRFTMKDIGRLQERIGNLEYYTHLSLLERDAESFEITDANGLNRFKAGFVVDAFQGHRLGDVKHPDYNVSIDQENNELRPPAKLKDVKLQEVATTDSERASSGYQKTGDLITLPYTEVVLNEQPYATRVERVTPVLTSHWLGHIELSPSGDEWFEAELAPELIVNVEGNYDAVMEANRDSIGTVWNAWQTQWSGVVSSSSNSWVSGSREITRNIQTVRTDQTRTGIRTDVVEQIDLESQGTRVIAQAMIPFCRQNEIIFEGSNFLPNTQLYLFFDRKDVNAYTTPAEGFSTSDASLIMGDALISSPSGKIEGTFQIPDPKEVGNPIFRCGEISFRLTASPNNITSHDPVTAGETTYFAKGILETEQETIIATRNAVVVRTDMNDATSIFSNIVDQNERQLPFGGNNNGRFSGQASFADGDDGDGDGDGGDGGDGGDADDGGDPLAQTFMVSEPGGAFLTSCDFFFQQKDDSIPITCEIRNVVNGYPGPKIMPFGRVVLEPSEVSVSEDGQTATKFTFKSPVYVQEGFEYCLCLLTQVPTWKVWIARMGETELQSTLIETAVGGTATEASNILYGKRTVSDQPDIGVMFKSHNNRTWAPSLMEDIKFTLRRARFTTTTGNVPLQNRHMPFWHSATSVKVLEENPVEFLDGSTTVQFKHKDHHMYSTLNNTSISRIASGAETTLDGAITNDASSIVLTSGTNFDDTTGKWSRDASSVWYIKIDDEIISYTTISTNTISSATRGVDNTTAAAHDDGAKVELYMLHKIPFTELNKVHTSLSNIGIDDYCVTTTASAYIDGTNVTRARNGGTIVRATENAQYDTASYNVSNMQLPGTNIVATTRPVTGTSPSGTQTSFIKTTESNAITVPLNENVYYDRPYLKTSLRNETNELAGARSLNLDLALSTEHSNVSPVIDTERMTVVAVANRINNIDSSADVYPTSEFVPSTEPEGDNNEAIYMTRKSTLAQSATALKVFFSANREIGSEIKVMFKILRSDDAMDFDELGWTYFNTNGDPDTTTNPSLGRDDFQEYLFTAGVTDDGLGDPLDEFIAFSIKIIMQTTNCAVPPRIQDFRAIALAT